MLSSAAFFVRNNCAAQGGILHMNLVDEVATYLDTGFASYNRLPAALSDDIRSHRRTAVGNRHTTCRRRGRAAAQCHQKKACSYQRCL